MLGPGQDTDAAGGRCLGYWEPCVLGLRRCPSRTSWPESDSVPPAPPQAAEFGGPSQALPLRLQLDPDLPHAYSDAVAKM